MSDDVGREQGGSWACHNGIIHPLLLCSRITTDGNGILEDIWNVIIIYIYAYPFFAAIFSAAGG